MSDASLGGHRLDFDLVGRADEHQGEEVAASSARLAHLSGFTGLAIVGRPSGTLYRRRYLLQVGDETGPG